jgi:hypothetical protein
MRILSDAGWWRRLEYNGDVVAFKMGSRQRIFNAALSIQEWAFRSRHEKTTE